MKDILHYKDFIGSVHFSAEDECFFGKIEGIDDFFVQSVKILSHDLFDFTGTPDCGRGEGGIFLRASFQE